LPLTRTRKVLSSFVIVVALVFAWAFWLTAFNDVEKTFGRVPPCSGLDGKVPDCPAIPSS
jgi:hypothetical protein